MGDSTIIKVHCVPEIIDFNTEILKEEWDTATEEQRIRYLKDLLIENFDVYNGNITYEIIK